MRICLDDYTAPVRLETGDGTTSISTSLGVVREPNGDLEYISMGLPALRTYIARDTITGDHTVVVLPEGFTPEQFGWKGWQFTRLSGLLDQIKEDTE